MCVNQICVPKSGNVHLSTAVPKHVVVNVAEIEAKIRRVFVKTVYRKTEVDDINRMWLIHPCLFPYLLSLVTCDKIFCLLAFYCVDTADGFITSLWSLGS